MGRIFLAALFLLPISAAFPAEPKWIHVSSSDFEMFSSAGEGDTRRVLQHFERVRSFFQQTVTSGAKRPDEPARIIVFGTKKEYEPYKPNEFASAFYTQIGGRDYIVIGGVTEDVFPTAVHEYVHLVVRHDGLDLPIWLNEGMADLYSTMRQLGNKVLVGAIPAGRGYQLAQEKWTPLATILAATRDSPYYNEKSKAGSLYSEGWALAHMLNLDPKYNQGFSKFFDLVVKGNSSAAALQSTYGKPLDVVEKELQTYILGSNLRGGLIPAKLQEGAKAAVEPAQAFDVKLALLYLGNRRSKAEETRKKLTELADEFPRRPEPHAALGYVAWSNRDAAGAVKEFTAAWDLGDRNRQMLWDYGRLAQTQDAEASVRALRTLLEMDPSRVEVRLALAGTLLTNRNVKDALETLAAVKSVKAADAPRLFELLAYARMENGETAVARRNAERWLENAKEDEQREKAQEFLDAVDRSRPVARIVPQTLAAPDLDTAVDQPPRLVRRPDGSVAVDGKPGESMPSLEGKFVELDCSGPVPGFIVQTEEGKVTLMMDEPKSIVLGGDTSGTLDLSCGPQQGVPVRVLYVEDTSRRYRGSVRAIEFGR